MTQKNTTEAAAAAAADNTQDVQTVSLDTPIQRPGGDVHTVQVRKPMAGALRGVSLADLLQLKVDAIQQVLPRVTTPTLLKPEVDNLDPADLLQLGTAVIGFLLPKAQRADFQPE